MKGDRERCLASGMDGYVAKPIQALELLQAIEQLIPTGGDDGSRSDHADRPPTASGTQKRPSHASAAINSFSKT